MDFEQLINTMTPEVHQSLKRAIEIGKWPDGRKLTQKQKEICMEAVISYEQRFVAEEDRVGFIDRGPKQEGELCDDSGSDSVDVEKPIKWTH